MKIGVPGANSLHVSSRVRDLALAFRLIALADLFRASWPGLLLHLRMCFLVGSQRRSQGMAGSGCAIWHTLRMDELSGFLLHYANVRPFLTSGVSWHVPSSPRMDSYVNNWWCSVDSRYELDWDANPN